MLVCVCVLVDVLSNEVEEQYNRPGMFHDDKSNKTRTIHK